MSHWIRVQKTINTGRKDQATMVFGTNVKVRKEIRMAKGDLPSGFADACEAAGVKPTVRQRNKFNRGVGAAFKAKGQA